MPLLNIDNADVHEDGKIVAAGASVTCPPLYLQTLSLTEFKAFYEHHLLYSVSSWSY